MREPTMRIYLADDGWRWRLRAANGRIIASSGESFTRKASAVRAAHAVLDAAYDAACDVLKVES